VDKIDQLRFKLVRENNKLHDIVKLGTAEDIYIQLQLSKLEEYSKIISWIDEIKDNEN